jgi:mono/diheme cytochrome c family protein
VAVVSLLGVVFSFFFTGGGYVRAAETEATVPGVARPQLAWQHWMLNCQGCHRQDGSGSADTAPALEGNVARFTTVAGGREYLVRVPGVATSALNDVDLAEVLNWALWRFDRDHLPDGFEPYSAAEIKALRGRPLRLEASRTRALLLERIRGHAPAGSRAYL